MLLRIEHVFDCRRRGVELKIVEGEVAPQPDPALLRALRNATDWAARLRSGTPLQALAKSEGISERYMGRIIHLDGLSPRLKRAIVEGTQPVPLTLKKLLRAPLPLPWDAQERMLGLGR
ncbi:hypothetical protein [Psychromarinibacter sp. S121]|uniref:hypothetical protein n=1 Tax=Psychromarinibacter sp. S121 TaxID=3415127 RepID=UPI003C7BE6F5